MDEGGRSLKMRDYASAQERFQLALIEAEKFGHNSSDLALTMERLATSIVQAGMWTEENAELCYRLYERACSIYEAVLGPVNAKVAMCLTGMARLIWLWDADAAAQLILQAISIYRELRSSNIVEPLELLSRVPFLEDPQIELLLKTTREIINEFGDDRRVLPRAWMILANKAVLSDDEMIEHLKKALSLAEGDSEQSALIVEGNLELGKKLFYTEKFREAEVAFESAVAFGECSPDVTSRQLEDALCRLSRVHTVYHRDFAQAEKLLRRAEEIRDAHYPSIHLNTEYRIFADTTGNYRHYIKNLTSDLCDYRNEAAKLLEEQDSAGYESILMTESSVLAEMAKARRFMGDIEQSIELCKAALAIDIGTPVRKNAIVSKVTPLLAWSYAKTGRIEHAVDTASGIIDAVNEHSHLDTLATCLELTHLLGQSENFDRLLNAAMKNLEDNSGDSTTQQSYLTIAFALAVSDRFSLASDLLGKAIARGEVDSVFSAWLYELFEWKLRKEGCAALADILANESTKIRDNYERKVCHS